MTVRELIEKLLAMPDHDRDVLVMDLDLLTENEIESVEDDDGPVLKVRGLE